MVFRGIFLMLAGCITALTFSNNLVAQSTDELESSLKQAGGMQRLEILHALTEVYVSTKDRKSVKYGRQAVNLADNLYGDNVNDSLWIKSQFLLAKAYYSQEKYFTAKEYFSTVKLISNRNTTPAIVNATTIYLSKIDSIAKTEEGLKQGFFSRTLTDINLGSSISNITSNVETGYLMNQAEKATEKEEYDRAIELYHRAATEFDREGDLLQLSDVYRKIGLAYKEMGEERKSREFFSKAMSVDELKSQMVEEPGNTIPTVSEPPTIKSSDSIVQALAKKGYSVEAPQTGKTPQPEVAADTDLSTTINQLEEQSHQLEELSKQAVQKQDFQTLARLRDQLAELEQDKLELEIIEREKNLLAQDVRITELTLKAREEELAKESRLRKALVGGAVFLTTFLISIGFLYSAKRKDHKKLTKAYSNLDEANHKLTRAEKRIKTLLNQQVSGDVARELIQSEADHPSKNKYVCVMFLDIRDFTAKVEGLSPEQIIQYQNHVFGSMIEIVDRHKGIINQFMGDGFMATFGAPQSRGNDCQHAYDAALEIIKVIDQKSEAREIPSTRLGIGLHAGYVVTGNVGTDIRKQYSITGSTVIIASRLEQLNKRFESQIILSQEVLKNLDHPPENPEIKLVNVKGVKGQLEIITLV